MKFKYYRHAREFNKFSRTLKNACQYIWHNLCILKKYVFKKLKWTAPKCMFIGFIHLELHVAFIPFYIDIRSIKMQMRIHTRSEIANDIDKYVQPHKRTY